MPEPIDTAYIHIPFCKAKCFYCDFISYANQDDHMEEYFNALVREIQLVDSFYTQSGIGWRSPLKSIFFGGGTPSYVPSKYIVRVLDELRMKFGFAEGVEITLECNPGTVDRQKFYDYKSAGINRISIGLQSSSDKLLQKIGRIHTLREFEQCMDDADKAGLMNRNVDLMFGLPSQTMKEVRESIRLVLQRKVAHVSFYSLILEEGTPFYQKYKCNSDLLPSEDLEREMYWSGIEELTRNGYLHYEISNLAKQGYYCNQNIAYWKTREYFGFGAGAHSYQQRTRIENDIGIGSYIRRIQTFQGCSNAPGAAEKNILSKKERELEFFMLGFRLLEGVDIREFERIFQSKADPYFPGLEKLTEQGLLVHKQDSYRLTKRGIDFANQVFMEFV